MCPGSRPATGWIANFTSMPRSRSFRVRSATGYCAWATAMPYPGVITTLRASVSIAAAPSAVISRCSP
jgi:hypothetical protein